MKKIISFVLTVFVAFTCLTLTACSKDEGSKPGSDSKYIGTWEATKAVFKGEETPIEEVLDSTVYILDLKADGTAVVTTDSEETGTWTEKKDGVHVKAGDTDADFPADGDTLTISILGAKIVFEKK